MATFSSITDVTQDPPYPATTKTNKYGHTVVLGPFTAPATPVPYVGTYEPVIETIEKSPVNGNGSWKEIRRRGQIVMSPYYHRKTVTRNFVAGTREHSWFVRNWYWTDATVVPNQCLMTELIRLRSHRTEQGDSRYWSDVKGMVPISVNSYDGDVQDAIATSQSSVIAAFKGGFDALTQSAESREALSYFRDKSDETRSLFSKLQGAYGKETRAQVRQGANAKQLLKSADSVTRQFGKRWMEYRYAIMPLIYAFQDVKHLYENAGRTYETFKSRERITLNPEWPSGLPGKFIVQRSSGTIDVTSTIVAGYAPSGLHSFVSSQLQSNIFATAWELIPLSFVIDWFVNVGDFIVANTSLDLSLGAKGCTAIRKRILFEEVLVDDREIKLEYHSNPAPPCRPNGLDLVESYKNSVHSHLVQRELDHYDRILFDVNSADLALYNDPLGNWKRLVDSAALSYQPLKKLLRSFK